MVSKLMDKIKKNSTIKQAQVLSDSKFFSNTEFVTTSIPAINIALSGSLDGGFSSGLTIWAGPSKHFKTSFTLLMMKAYLDKYKDSIAIFYDSEFGSPQSYFSSFGIDLSRVFHIPITNIEEFKFDVAKQLEGIERGDKVFIACDSVGNLASSKEVTDALEAKSVADMTRAKALKSVFRIVTPQLVGKDIPMVVVNHTYQTQEMYSKAVVSGGCLAKGTEIRMADGTTKNVENIVIGDTVITSQGLKPVTYTWDPETLIEGTPDCYEIEFEDGHTVIASDKHMFLSNGEWVCAKDLCENADVDTL